MRLIVSLLMGSLKADFVLMFSLGWDSATTEALVWRSACFD